ncbi:AraC family transcriptional regulator [Leeia sp. TBRC 13508]|uniref:AraC family transcriptional regulator n=1 Tax=Leeia speluncae TaxID=2884804 RepID=A0ABS8D7E3_9NEIS|nr:AraC family transcriptional regulator [Leeia speluncae]MCB6184124.1 AraC family transcriptional regulator [Leeia speluncae]
MGTLLSATLDTPLDADAFQVSVRHYNAEQHHHSHPYTQALFCITGQLDLELENHAHLISPGQGIYISASDRHGFYGMLNPACLVVNLPEAVNGTTKQAFQLPADAIASLHQLHNRLKYAPDDPLLLMSIRQQIRQWSNINHSPSAKRLLNFQRLDEWINEQLVNPDLDVAALANLSHWSVAHFRERFTQEIGITPAKLIQQRRSLLAQSLLKAGYSVAAVSARCGYQSPSALTAMLKQTIGKTAREISSDQ